MRYSWEQHQLITSRLFISTYKLSYCLGIGQQTCRDLLRKSARKSIVILHIAITGLSRPISQGKVSLCPQLRLPRPPSITPRRQCLISRPSKCPWWSTTVHIAICIASHAHKSRVTQAAHQQFRPLCARRLRPNSAFFPQGTQYRELLRKSLSP